MITQFNNINLKTKKYDAVFVYRTTEENESIIVNTPGTNDFVIDWGDDSIQEHITTINPTHTYNTPGDYSVKIKGSFNKFGKIGSSNINLLKVLILNQELDNLTFWGNNNLEYCNLLYTDMSNLTSFEKMFQYDNNLSNVNFGEFDASNINNMSSMFQDCKKLSSIDLSNFNTSNVTDMKGMFFNCEKLTSLDLSNFNTSNVTDMAFMFQGCNHLVSLNLSNFDTSNVTKMDHMFYDTGNNCCITATNNLTTTQLPTVSYMFSYSYIAHPTSTEQTALTSASGSTYTYSGC